MELRIALAGGHSMYDDVIAGEIVKALDRFGRQLQIESKRPDRGDVHDRESC